MKNFGAPALALTLRLPTFDSPHAAEASREIEEQTTGKSPGGMNGMLIGALFGGEAQEASGRPVPHRVLFLPSAPVPPPASLFHPSASGSTGTITATLS
ncbi:hypothetical protein ACFSHR_16540 [Azotobacter chroococcum]